MEFFVTLPDIYIGEGHCTFSLGQPSEIVVSYFNRRLKYTGSYLPQPLSRYERTRSPTVQLALESVNVPIPSFNKRLVVASANAAATLPKLVRIVVPHDYRGYSSFFLEGCYSWTGLRIKGTPTQGNARLHKVLKNLPLKFSDDIVVTHPRVFFRLDHPDSVEEEINPEIVALLSGQIIFDASDDDSDEDEANATS